MSVYGYRRGSIFWALTLIAVGVIFLYQNFNPAVRPWHIIAKFWPILIIFWGLSKLIDYFHARTHPETVSPPRFAASEVILLVLILALGTLVSKIVLRPWQEWGSAVGINLGDEDFANLFLDSFTYTQTLSQPVKPQPHLLVVNRRGDIEIHASDGSALEAVVKKTIRAANEEAAKKISDQLQIQVVEQAGQYVLQSNLDALPNQGSMVRLDITLRVPKATSTEITTERGDVSLEGLKADQTLTTKRGDAHVTKIEGLVRVHKSRGSTEVRDVKGNVDLDGRGRDVEIAGVTGAVTVNGEFSGNVQFQNVTQALRFNSSRTDMTVQRLTGHLNMEVGDLVASGVDGPFEISTRHKDITLTDFKHSVKIVNSNGDVQLRTKVPPTQPIEVDLKKGEIELDLPAACSFQIEASSRHGEVECDFSGSGLKINKEGESPSVTGTYGKGGPTIRLSTAYGTIRITRQSAGTLPAPPAPPAPPRPPAEESDRTATHPRQPGSPPAVRLVKSDSIPPLPGNKFVPRLPG